MGQREYYTSFFSFFQYILFISITFKISSIRQNLIMHPVHQVYLLGQVGFGLLQLAMARIALHMQWQWFWYQHLPYVDVFKDILVKQEPQGLGPSRVEWQSLDHRSQFIMFLVVLLGLSGGEWIQPSRSPWDHSPLNMSHTPYPLRAHPLLQDPCSWKTSSLQLRRRDMVKHHMAIWDDPR